MSMYNLIEYSSNWNSKNEALCMLLKYLSNFWRSLEMTFNDSKIELKLKQTKYYVLSTARNDNDNTYDNNIVFNIKDTKLYVPVLTLSRKDNQKLSKHLSKGFEISVYGNEYKTKCENENMMNINIFSNQFLLDLIDYLF